MMETKTTHVVSDREAGLSIEYQDAPFGVLKELGAGRFDRLGELVHRIVDAEGNELNLDDLPSSQAMRILHLVMRGIADLPPGSPRT